MNRLPQHLDPASKIRPTHFEGTYNATPLDRQKCSEIATLLKSQILTSHELLNIIENYSAGFYRENNSECETLLDAITRMLLASNNSEEIINLGNNRDQIISFIEKNKIYLLEENNLKRVSEENEFLEEFRNNFLRNEFKISEIPENVLYKLAFLRDSNGGTILHQWGCIFKDQDYAAQFYKFNELKNLLNEKFNELIYVLDKKGLDYCQTRDRAYFELIADFFKTERSKEEIKKFVERARFYFSTDQSSREGSCLYRKGDSLLHVLARLMVNAKSDGEYICLFLNFKVVDEVAWSIYPEPQKFLDKENKSQKTCRDIFEDYIFEDVPKFLFTKEVFNHCAKLHTMRTLVNQRSHTHGTTFLSPGRTFQENLNILLGLPTPENHDHLTRVLSRINYYPDLAVLNTTSVVGKVLPKTNLSSRLLPRPLSSMTNPAVQMPRAPATQLPKSKPGPITIGQFPRSVTPVTGPFGASATISTLPLSGDDLIRITSIRSELIKVLVWPESTKKFQNICNFLTTFALPEDEIDLIFQVYGEAFAPLLDPTNPKTEPLYHTMTTMLLSQDPRLPGVNSKNVLILGKNREVVLALTKAKKPQLLDQPNLQGKKLEQVEKEFIGRCAVYFMNTSNEKLSESLLNDKRILFFRLSNGGTLLHTWASLPVEKNIISEWGANWHRNMCRLESKLKITHPEFLETKDNSGETYLSKRDRYMAAHFNVFFKKSYDLGIRSRIISNVLKNFCEYRFSNNVLRIVKDKKYTVAQKKESLLHVIKRSLVNSEDENEFKLICRNLNMVGKILQREKTLSEKLDVSSNNIIEEYAFTELLQLFKMQFPNFDDLLVRKCAALIKIEATRNYPVISFASATFVIRSEMKFKTIIEGILSFCYPNSIEFVKQMNNIMREQSRPKEDFITVPLFPYAYPSFNEISKKTHIFENVLKMMCDRKLSSGEIEELEAQVADFEKQSDQPVNLKEVIQRQLKQSKDNTDCLRYNFNKIWPGDPYEEGFIEETGPRISETTDDDASEEENEEAMNVGLNLQAEESRSFIPSYTPLALLYSVVQGNTTDVTSLVPPISEANEEQEIYEDVEVMPLPICQNNSGFESVREKRKHNEISVNPSNPEVGLQKSDRIKRRRLRSSSENSNELVSQYKGKYKRCNSSELLEIIKTSKDMEELVAVCKLHKKRMKAKEINKEKIENHIRVFREEGCSVQSIQGLLKISGGEKNVSYVAAMRTLIRELANRTIMQQS